MSGSKPVPSPASEDTIARACLVVDRLRASLERPIILLGAYPGGHLDRVTGEICARARKHHHVRSQAVKVARVGVLDSARLAVHAIGLFPEGLVERAQGLGGPAHQETEQPLDEELREFLKARFAIGLLETFSDGNSDNFVGDEWRVLLGIFRKEKIDSALAQDRQVALANWIAEDLLVRTMGLRALGAANTIRPPSGPLSETHVFELSGFVLRNN